MGKIGLTPVIEDFAELKLKSSDKKVHDDFELVRTFFHEVTTPRKLLNSAGDNFDPT